MKTDEVITKLRSMYVRYTADKVGLTPALLPEYLAEFLGYTNLLYSHYSEYIVKYREAEAEVLAEENDQRDQINQVATARDDKRSITEMDNRITIRMASLKGKKEKLEAEVKSATLHINTIQSLMKRYSDEAKGQM